MALLQSPRISLGKYIKVQRPSCNRPMGIFVVTGLVRPTTDVRLFILLVFDICPTSTTEPSSLMKEWTVTRLDCRPEPILGAIQASQVGGYISLGCLPSKTHSFELLMQHVFNVLLRRPGTVRVFTRESGYSYFHWFLRILDSYGIISGSYLRSSQYSVEGLRSKGGPTRAITP